MGQILAIPNSTFSADNSLAGKLAFSNFAIADTEIVGAAMGGHGDSSDNSVLSFDLVSAYGWELRKANTYSGSGDNSVPYYADGSAASRHTYNTAHYSPTNARLLLHGTYSTHPNAVGFADTAGFNLATNTWDAQGTWDDVPAGGACKDAAGNVWAISDAPTRRVHKWVQSSATWADRFFHNDGAVRPYAPMCEDTTRSTIFCCRELSGSLRAVLLTSDGTAAANVTFDASAALTQFLSEGHEYGTMIYDSNGDRFLHFGEKTATVFVITPTAGTTGWTMSVLSTTGASLPTPVGTMGRLIQWAEYDTAVFIPRANSPMYAMRYA